MKPKTVYVVQFMGRTEWIEDYSVHPCRTKVIAITPEAYAAADPSQSSTLTPKLKQI